ncbi:hypothetical protein [Latilactobacillus curvatus]|uniref:hypothetical protein n=1 Tax=Latilactobacillus curvatus TaxID=28038 RepID=UPI00217E7689|nr:hypothetical protein [Latilactobacillus curvatus]
MDHKEIAIRMVESWLQHAERTSNKSISTKEVAQAYLDFYSTIINQVLPESMEQPEDK